jgi:hypothetical protein
MNFHAYGNLFIHPFNYDTGLNTEMKSDEYKEISLIYEEIFNTTGVP